MNKNPPSLRADEIKFKLNINVPNQIFDKPILESSIELPEDGFNERLREYEFVLKEIKNR